MKVTVNCDMGESFGIYQMGDDSKIMPHITHANVACGFHASDPNHMQRTVLLAKEHDVNVGAHFSLPDLQGFGRREMKMKREELRNLIVYQVGALMGFLQKEELVMSHLKPHGALYMMAATQEHVALAIADVAKIFRLPVFGMTGTLQEEVYKAEGVEFIAEFYADLDYDPSGNLIVTREHDALKVEDVIHKVQYALANKRVIVVDGSEVVTGIDTICVHSDTPNAEELVLAVSSCIAI